MNKTKALDKIRKCLALAGSDNPHEAARAMAQAQALMQQHGVTEHDIELADVKEAASKAASVTPIHWDAWLADVVARAFGCECLRNAGTKLHVPANLLVGVIQLRRYAHWSFVGVGTAPEVASYAYDVLARQCIRARRAHMAKQPKACKPATRTARGDAFAEGWVRAVSNLVAKFAGTEHHQPKIAAYLQQRYPDIKSCTPTDRTKGRNVKTASLYDGYDEGRRATLHGAVGTAGQQLQIGGGV